MSPDADPTAGAPLPFVDRLHHDLVTEAGIEAHAPSASLFWSAVGAGLAISFSFLAGAAAAAAVPTSWAGLATAFAYPLGFLIVVGGRYQLFTENTLPPVARVLERLDTVPSLLRLWSIVLVGNLAGALVVGAFLGVPGVLPDPVAEAGLAMLTLDAHVPAFAIFARALLAGWLVAGMVWLIHRMDGSATIPVLWACTAVMPLLHLEHVVVGSVEAAWAVQVGVATPALAARHLLITLAGNTAGGVLLVAILNHARTARAHPDRPRLPWRSWLFGLPLPAPHPDTLHGIQGMSHWWLTARGRHPLPARLYDTPAQMARDARHFGASRLVLHRKDGPVRVIDLARHDH
ncbi:MAG: formate/nitrite transporter family protein [Alphaproteobacteria bacterium]|nr:formate/nitrite transporter family protein [Alphaproteobacteria bacterium]